MTLYAAPGTEGSIVDYRERYDNYIGGQWVAPVNSKALFTHSSKSEPCSP